MNTTKPRNARFWVFWGDAPVKLTLKPDQELIAHRGGPTDEGWVSYEERWEYDGENGVVRSEVDERGADCDGRYSRHWEGFCILELLQGGTEDQDSPGIFYPVWETEDRSQRDYAAEAAGY